MPSESMEINFQKQITAPTPAKPIPARKTLQISTESDDGFPEQTPDLPVEPRDDNESGGDSSDVASEEDSESGGDDAEDDEFNNEDADNAEDAEELISENNSNSKSPSPSIEPTPSADDSSPLEQQHHTSPAQPTTPAASSRRFPPALTPEQIQKVHQENIIRRFEKRERRPPQEDWKADVLAKTNQRNLRIWRDTRGGSDGPINFCWMTHEDYLRTDKAKHWREAMDKEMSTLMEFGTWKLVDLPPGRKTIGCKWHLVQKTNDDGTKGEYKARLVAKGYKQIEGIDFFDTFAPVARIQGIRLLMTIATDLGLDIRHLDIKAAYLNGYMEELIFMEQPPGYESGDGKVCQLIRGLYGTKQAGRIWNKDLHKTLTAAGFKRLIHDQCLYSKGDINDKENFVLLAVYVDDILLFNHPEGQAAADSVVKVLQEKYTVKDMGPAKRYVGIQMTRDKELGNLTMSQEPMIEDILQRFQMTDAKPANTPMEEGLDLNDPEGVETDKPYRSLVGSLMYLATCTRPDIAYAVSKLSRYLSKPTDVRTLVMVCPIIHLTILALLFTEL
jgi:Reverse transcriptase (RNA-dependent DNA polymerase)